MKCTDSGHANNKSRITNLHVFHKNGLEMMILSPGLHGCRKWTFCPSPGVIPFQ